jgi:hypothetical protein
MRESDFVKVSGHRGRSWLNGSIFALERAQVASQPLNSGNCLVL